jgi:hypothetical protein
LELSLDPQITIRRLLLEMVGFALVYGFFLISFIDSSNPSSSQVYGPYYHLWLIAMYFAPFVAISIMVPDHWEIFVSLGLLASLMNDDLWGFFHLLAGDFTSAEVWQSEFYRFVRASLALVPSGYQPLTPSCYR